MSINTTILDQSIPEPETDLSLRKRPEELQRLRIMLDNILIYYFPDGEKANKNNITILHQGGSTTDRGDIDVARELLKYQEALNLSKEDIKKLNYICEGNMSDRLVRKAKKMTDRIFKYQ